MTKPLYYYRRVFNISGFLVLYSGTLYQTAVEMRGWVPQAARHSTECVSQVGCLIPRETIPFPKSVFDINRYYKQGHGW